MSLVRPGCDTRHIVQQAVNSRSLAKIGRGEAIGVCEEMPPKEIYTSGEYKKPVVILNKESLEEFKAKCKGKTQDELFEILGIKTRTTHKGEKAISHYSWPYISYSFQAAGIDEEKLLEGVTCIDGNCNLTGSSLKNLGNVKSVLGSLTIPLYGKLEDLSNVEYIGRNINIDVENQEDAVKKIKELNLNPKHLNGSINPSAMGKIYGLDYIFSPVTGFEKSLNLLQATTTYAVQ